MTGFTHMLVGGAVGIATGNPLLVPVTAFASHFVFDLIPHDDYLYYYNNHWKYVYLSPFALAQLIGGGLLVLFLGWRHEAGFVFLLGSFFGVLPDLITGTLVITGHKDNFFNRLHHRLHNHTELGEVFYRRFAKGELLPKNGKEAGQENWRRIKGTFWGNFGWGIELAFELVIVVLALKFIV